ncbi:MAG: CRTAC1 family protein [Acidobacteriota bacterium]
MSAPQTAPARSPGRASFVDVAAQHGIHHHSVCGSPGKATILDTLGTGACWIDFDGDADLDLFLPNGTRLQLTEGETPPLDALFENRGRRFTDVTVSAGLASSRWAVGCAVADYDADGDPDLFVTHYGPDILYRNNGDGTFTDVAARAGVADPGWSSGAAFADYDGDGWLDLYVARYLEFDPARAPRPGSTDACRFRGMPVMCGPRGLVGLPDLLYHNEGDGTFTEVSVRAGLMTQKGYYGLGVVWGDFDNDGDPDLYVANDSTPNLLYRNGGDGTFQEIAIRAGVGYSVDGREQAGMGVDFGDYDGDGRLDLFVTNFSHDFATLYHNDGHGFFSDATFRSGLVESTLPTLGWGARFFDFDLDGDLDLFVANGHVYPEVDRYDIGTRYRQMNHLFENDGGGRFIERTAEAGPGLAILRSSRAAALADFDDDGDSDVLITNIDSTPNLLENRSTRGHWIGLELVGVAPNLDAIGARLILSAGGRRQIREVRGDSSYLSHSDLRVVFGLGGDTRIDALEVRWPDGRVQKIPLPPLGRYTRLLHPAAAAVKRPAGSEAGGGAGAPAIGRRH